MSNRMPGNLRMIIIFLLAVCLLPGCQTVNASMHDIGDYSRDSILQNVSVGNLVRVRTASGETFRFAVTSIEENTLSGSDIIVHYSDIERLDVQRDLAPSAGSSSSLPTILLGVLLVVGIIALANSNDDSGPRCTGSPLFCNALIPR